MDADHPAKGAPFARRSTFLADPQVGSAGFRLDLGIRHPDKPGTYILAVECDGATYHSALWARERDRLRQEVLEHLGWHFHRIWSTDWFYNRRFEIERLRTVLFEARARAENGIIVKGANQHRPVSAPSDNNPIVFELPAVIEREMPPYKRAIFPIRSPYEPHEVAISTLAELVGKIVDAEGPIHVEEIARRMASCFGKEKAGSRILAVTKTALVRAQSRNSEFVSDGNFWFTRTQANGPPVRERSAETGATIKAANISLLEIRAALEIARNDNAGGDDAELIRTVARLLGFKRVGPDLQARISEGL